MQNIIGINITDDGDDGEIFCMYICRRVLMVIIFRVHVCMVKIQLEEQRNATVAITNTYKYL